jgi:hypothetical protein
MKTTTNHTVILSEIETRAAIAAYLRNRDVPVPASGDGITVKWTAKGEAKVSFEVTEGEIE